jgi:hypothetical protein
VDPKEKVVGEAVLDAKENAELVVEEEGDEPKEKEDDVGVEPNNNPVVGVAAVAVPGAVPKDRPEEVAAGTAPPEAL